MKIDNRWKYLGISLLALIAVQILQGILFLGLSLATREIQVSSWLVALYWVPAVISVVGGGVFQGRLIPFDQPWVWIVTGTVNAAWPVVYHFISTSGDSSALKDPVTSASALASVVFWYLGCKIGVFSRIKKPADSFDGNLLKITAIVTGLIVGLNIVSWASIQLNQGFRLAKKIQLPLPPDVEVVPGESPNPWIAGFHRFTRKTPPGDLEIYSFYKNYFKEPDYEDVTSRFQSDPAGKWVLKNEQIEDREYSFQSLSAQWRDLSGKVLISLYLQAEKSPETTGWDTGEWQVNGLIMSRAYAEPPKETPIPATASATPGMADTLDQRQPAQTSGQADRIETPNRLAPDFIAEETPAVQ